MNDTLLCVWYVCDKNRHVFQFVAQLLRQQKDDFRLNESTLLDMSLVQQPRWKHIYVIVFGHLSKQCGTDLLWLKQRSVFQGAILVEHGTSHLKHYLVHEKRAKMLDLVLVCNRLQKKIHDQLWPKLSTIITGIGYSKALLHPLYTRSQVCEMFHLDQFSPIILIAPTWVGRRYANEFFEALIPEIKTIPNHVLSLHSVNKRYVAHNKDVNVARVDLPMSSTLYLLPHADIVISDTSSVMFEFLHFKRPIIQLLCKRYSNNPAEHWELPVSVPNNRPFLLGTPFKLGQDTNLNALTQLLLSNNPEEKSVATKYADCSGVVAGAHKTIVRAIRSFVLKDRRPRHRPGRMRVR
jgi:hypothetical protein